jgi:hypothetical protein
MANYQEAIEYLGSKQITDETVASYFDEVFPAISTVKSEKKVSKNAKAALLALTNQPGVEFAPNSWWQAFNAVTYVTNHQMGRNQENRVESIWFGTNDGRNREALALAKEYADKA